MGSGLRSNPVSGQFDGPCTAPDGRDPDGSAPDLGAFGGAGADLSDCDDSDPNVYPGAQELTDGLDNNCDGHIPELEVPQCSGAWVGGRCVGEGCEGCGNGEAAALLPLLMVWRRRRPRGRAPGLGAPIGDVRSHRA